MKNFYEKHMKILLSIIFSTLLIASIISYITISKSNHHPTLNPTTHAILKSSCSSTRYPDLCYNAIASGPTHIIAKISTTKDIITASLNLTIITVEHNYFTVQKIIKTRPNLTIREKCALHDCLETIDDTLDELKQTLIDLQNYHPSKNNNYRGKFDLEAYVDDMKTLISSAITNQETCLDGFSHNNVDRLLRQVLEKGQFHVEKMCSNALAMIKNLTDYDISTIIKSSDRRLYSEGNGNWPRWMTRGDRRMLEEGGVKADVVVAGVPVKSSKRYVIRIKEGVYKENVEVDKKKTNIMFIGDGRSKTIITGSRNVMVVLPFIRLLLQLRAMDS